MNTIEKLTAAFLIAGAAYVVYERTDNRQYCTETTTSHYIQEHNNYDKQVQHQTIKAGRCD